MKNQFIYIEKTNSTNDYLKKLSKVEELQNGTVVFTDFQSNGKGQMGNSWQSEKGKNLLFSIYIEPKEIEVLESFIISKIVAISIKKVLDKYAENISIKWTNDIYWKNKKMGGILIENSVQKNKITSSVVGIGLNINQKTFDDNLPNPISLFNVTQKKVDKKNLLEQIIDEIIANFQSYNKDEIDKKYFESLFLKDKKTEFLDVKKQQKFWAVIKNVENSGQLILETAEKEIRKYFFKEVEFIFD